MSIGEFQQGSWPNVGADGFTRVRGEFVQTLVAERDAAIARAKEWEEKYKGAEQAGILMAGALTAVQDKIDELEKRLAEICGQEPVAIYRGAIDCGEHGASDLEILRMIPHGAKLIVRPELPKEGEGK